MAGAPSRFPAGFVWRAKSWRAGSGSTNTSVRTVRLVASFTNICGGEERNRTGAAVATPGGDAFPGASISVSGLRSSNRKLRVGDWEADTIVGAGQSGAVASVVDRVSKLTRLARVDRKTSEDVGSGIQRRLEADRHLVHTITADNGKEFAGHISLSKALDAKFYFARPYHSWERGLNEHTNGLVRQYFPKGTDFRSVTDAEVQAVEDLLNTRPRKALGFRTPEEVFTHAQAPP